MERIPRGIYTQEFREQVVKLVEIEGLSIKDSSAAAGRLIRTEKDWGMCGFWIAGWLKNHMVQGWFGLRHSPL